MVSGVPWVVWHLSKTPVRYVEQFCVLRNPRKHLAISLSMFGGSKSRFDVSCCNVHYMYCDHRHVLWWYAWPTCWQWRCVKHISNVDITSRNNVDSWVCVCHLYQSQLECIWSYSVNFGAGILYLVCDETKRMDRHWKTLTDTDRH